jgi:hypothetical protein
VLDADPAGSPATEAPMIAIEHTATRRLHSLCMIFSPLTR